MQFNRRKFALSALALPLVKASGIAAQSASPAASPVGGAEGVALQRLNALLQFVPGGILDEQIEVVWVDVDSQIAALAGSADVPADEAFPLFAQSAYGNMPPLFQTSEMLGVELGFTTLDVSQALGAGIPPDTIQIVELNFPVADLPATWESAGYERLENDRGESWSIGEDASIDFNNPIQRAALARFNNIAIVGENTLAFAPTSDLMGAILATAAGQAPAKVEELAIVSAGIPEEGVGAWFVDGNMVLLAGATDMETATDAQLLAAQDEILAESDAANAPMPAIRTICTGITAGAGRQEEMHLPDATTWIVLETDQAGQAELAGKVVEWRLQNMISIMNGVPFAELIGPVIVDVISPEVVRISASGEAAMRSTFSQMIMSRDILPFAW